MAPNNNPQIQKTPPNLHKIQRYKSFGSLFVMVIVYCLGFIYYGHSTTYLGTFKFATVMKIFKIDMEQNIANGLYSGCVYFGGGCGALLALLFIKKFSRRQSLIITTVMAFITNILILVPNYILLFICRFFQGLSSGLFSAVIPLIIKEILPIQISGTFGAFSALFILIGISLTYLVQFIMLEIIGSYQGYFEGYWRIIFSFSLPPIIIKFLLLVFVYDYETPKYLLQQDRQEECIQLLQKIYKEEYVEEVLRQKKIDLGIMEDSDSSDYSASALKKAEEIEAQNKKQNRKPQIELEKQKSEKPEQRQNPQVRRQQQAQQQMSQDLPRHKVFLRRFVAIDLILMKQFVGPSLIVPYGSYITSLVFPQLTTLIPFLLFATNALASMFVSFLLSRFGRKPLLQIGKVVTIISLVMITIGFFLQSEAGNILVVVGLFVWMVATGASVFTIVWLYIAEIVQPAFITVPTMLNWFLAVVIIIIFPILQEAITAGPIFAFFAIYCSIFLIVNQKLLIETKDKTQTEIYTQYDELF